MKLNIKWKKVLYGIALIVIGIILAALHFIVAGKGIGFLVVALVVVGLVFNASGVKDVLLQLFNKIIGTSKWYCYCADICI